MGELQKFADYGILDETWFNLLVDKINSLTSEQAKRGTATITAGSTYVDVTHGFGTTPDDVKITPIDNLAGRSFWVSNIGATTFRINISGQDLSNHQFKWEVT